MYKSLETLGAKLLSSGSAISTGPSSFKYVQASPEDARNPKLHQKHCQLEADRTAVFGHLEPFPKHDYLCDLSTAELRAELKSGAVTPLEMLRAFQRRTARLIPLNCIAESIKEAPEQAESITEIDLDFPLSGIPISIKEEIQVAGYDACNGLLLNACNPATRDAVVVRALKAGGGIPFVTTNMPPYGMSIDSSNAIYGTQRHPSDKERLAGGSSGGEAVLLSCGGSPIGFGSDIAGSLRIPPSFCGICGLKPTFKRVSQVGLVSSYRKMIAHLHVCIGPMGRYVGNLADGMRSILRPAMFDADPSMHPIPFNEAKYAGEDEKHLTIGYYTELEGDLPAKTSPSIQRAVMEAKASLEKAGHRLVPFQPPSPDEALRLLFRAMLCDGGKYVAESLRDEPLPDSLQFTKYAAMIPSFMRRAAGTALSYYLGSGIGELVKYTVGASSPSDILHLNSEIVDYERSFYRAITDSGIDCILCPVFAFPAPRADTPMIYLNTGCIYTALYNLLDCPAGVVPVTRVTDDDEKAAKTMEEDLTQNGDTVNAALAKMQEGSKGLPLCVQIAGRPMQEETVLRVMREIEADVGYWTKA